MKKISIILLPLILGGCLSLTYQGVGKGVPVATVTFSKGYQVGLGDGAMDNYAISNTGECEDLGLAARFMSTTGSRSDAAIPAGGRLLIVAHVEYLVGEGVSYAGPGQFAIHSREFACTRSASFIPAEGASYNVVNRSERNGQCELSIIDQATNSPVPEIRMESGSGCPKGYARRYGAISFVD